MRRPRGVDVARTALGFVALARADLILRLTASPRHLTTPCAATRRTVQVLGGRYLVQATAGVLLHRSWLPEADAAVDLVHATSMLTLAALSPDHARPALVSAGAATVFAVADLQGRATSAGPDPRRKHTRAHGRR